MNRNIVVLFFLLISLFILSGCSTYRSIDQCKSACLKKGYGDGDCKWPKEVDGSMEEDFEGYPDYEKIENLGPCLIRGPFGIAKSAHCGNKGQCNCYCFNIK